MARSSVGAAGAAARSGDRAGSHERPDALDWRDRYMQAQDELALARYEAQKWKEKYLAEKQRRRTIAKSLLELMVLPERHSATETSSVRVSSSAFSDVDHIGNILSPTLSSFDFDDDEDEENESSGDSDGDDALGDRSGGGNVEVQSPSSVYSNRSSGDGSLFPSPTAADAHERESEDGFRSSGNGGLRRVLQHEQSSELMKTRVRTNRSSTTGSPNYFRSSSVVASGRRGGDLDGVDSSNGSPQQQTPPQSLIYRMMYSKPTSSRDLWQSRSSHPTKFSTIARSLLFSMHLRKERIFENFFVAGVTIGAVERAHAAKSATGLVGYWKPRVLYEYPQPFRTSGYTFQLTGAKGEVLHGFCVAVMGDLIERSESQQQSDPKSPSRKTNAQSSKPLSPRYDWSRASCPAIPKFSYDDSALHSRSANKKENGALNPLDSDDDDPDAAEANQTSLLAPVCYCFTSKFPFYRFHYTLLRAVVENELREKRQKLAGQQHAPPYYQDDEYEILLRPQLHFDVLFAICHRENTNVAGSSAATSGSSANAGGLGSIASPFHLTPTNRVALSEDTMLIHSATPSATANGICSPMTSPASKQVQSALHLMRKSHSSDDVHTYLFSANAVIVEKPIVEVIPNPSTLPEEYQQVQVGDVLEAIDGITTAALPSVAKLVNRFADLSREKVAVAALLHRAHDMKIGEPGSWSTARFPNFDVEYQLPKRHAERWSCGVVLRYLVPESVVKILAHLLLEKQVAIMSENPAKVTAVCTAFLLLLAPFQWQSTYIPLLPSGLLDFLHSPVPFLAGCYPLESTEEWPDVCFYNIDTDTITTPESTQHLNETSIPHGGEFCKLLYAARDRVRALRPSSKPWYELSEEEDKILTLTMQEAEIFLRDLCFDVSSYDLTPRSGQTFYDCLQEEVAKELRKSHFEEYLEEFSQTQLFCQYCESILKPEQQTPR
ncbi:Denn domain-containing protein 5a, partial [Globisporangium splendens]